MKSLTTLQPDTCNPASAFAHLLHLIASNFENGDPEV